MKRYLIGGIAVLAILAAVVNFDKILLLTMQVVDGYGEKTGAEVVGIIDGLNELYYSLGYK